MEQAVITPVEMSREISESGFLIVAAACFLFTSIATMILFFRWLLQNFNNVAQTQQQLLKALIELLKEHNS